MCCGDGCIASPIRDTAATLHGGNYIRERVVRQALLWLMTYMHHIWEKLAAGFSDKMCCIVKMKQLIRKLSSNHRQLPILLTVISWALASVYLTNHDNVLIESFETAEIREGKDASGNKEYDTFLAAVIAMSLAIWIWVISGIPWPMLREDAMPGSRFGWWVWVSLVPVLVIAIIATIRNARPNINMDSAGETGWGGNLYIAALYWMYLLVVGGTAVVIYMKLLSTKKYQAAIFVALITGGAMWGTVEGLKHSRNKAKLRDH